MDNGLDMGRTWVILGHLLGFAIAYNVLVGWWENTGDSEGLVWLEVVFGVAITGVGFALLVESLMLGLLLGACFMATGIPMCGGSIIRDRRARRRERKVLDDEA